MIVGNISTLKGKPITHPEAKGGAMKVLVSPQEGWEGYVMRVVEVEPEGYTPKHQHDWPHINYIIEGDGHLFMDGQMHPVTAGGYAYVPAGTLHQFSNAGKTPFKFICIVPEEGHHY